ncbi:MAG: hypothetical protein K8M05_39600, partial [Deltaproteobacteria bacterium]|nr:hypothetical protein [Kofleriaceae bacterium]
MREVSCRVFGVYAKPLAARGIPMERLVQGTNLDVATIKNKNERIDWSDAVVIHENVGKIFSKAELREIGASYFRTPALRFLFVVGRILLTPMEFIRWANKPKDGAGNQMFTCVVPAHRQLSDDECEVDLTLPEGYPVSWEFMEITAGNFEEMPRLLGYPAAKVDLSPIERGGRFHITVPKRTPFLTRMRRVVTWPLTVRAAARELQEAHLTLQERYEQLEDARTRLDRQATQLRTAYTVNELIQGDLDLDRTVDAIARALVGEAGFAGAELDVSAHVGDVAVARTVHRGTTEGKALVRTLDVQGERIGELRVFPKPDADRAEREELLAFIVPTVAMALHNALSFHAVQDYRRSLERRVEQRTHDLSVARDELAATVESREKLFQNISHEFRTPLALILLSVDTLAAAAGDRGDEASLAHLATVTSSARKLVRMVDELLLLAAGRERELTAHVEPVDLDAAIAASAAGWRLAA